MSNNELFFRPKLYKFEEVINAIIVDIESGILRPNELLMSKREAGERFCACKVTVDRAYWFLCKQRYIAYLRGVGYYVVGMPGQQTVS